MKIIFNKYGGIKTIEDRQLLVQSSIGSNFVDIYYQDDAGNFADETVNLATIAFKRADSFEISERTCDAVREELTNKILYFRYIFQEDELAVNGELQMTVRLKQVTFDPEDETKILLIKQKTMGKFVAHIYEAVGNDLEEYNVIDGRLLRLELWQDTFDGTFYDVTQIDAKLVLERQATNDSLDDHNTSNEAHLDIRQSIENLDNALQEQIDTINGTLSEQDFRINELEDFASNLEIDITEEIEQALSGKADLVDGKVPLEQLPDMEITKQKVEDVLTGDITSHNHATEINEHNDNENAHTGIRNAVAEAKAIAEGKSRARVFATKSALDTWLLDSENVALLQIGDNFYIEEIDKPDYWWNGTTIKELETQKVDLTEYAKKTDIPTLRPTIELEVASLTTLTELEKLTIKNQLSSLIVDDKIDGSKFDDIVLVKTSDLIRLHYSSIDYYVLTSYYPLITVIFETESTKYKLNVAVDDYTHSSLTSATTTIPTISTSITTDATSDTKTTSPKAVKDYVDTVLGDLATLLEGI